MIDAQGRSIEYMRISITDRCNLRCKYCMPEDLPYIGHDNILRYEEILRICSQAAALGIRRFRVTGGEPLVRRGCMSFLRNLKRLPGVEAVSVTTNGVLLEQHIAELASIGLDGVNISLDTLDQEMYAKLTGKDELPTVLRALEKSVQAGLVTKVNCVALAGINDGQLTKIATLASQMPVDVRFIELMPTGAGQPMQPVPGERVRQELLKIFPDLRLTDEQRGWGPARYWRSEALLGRIGFIDVLSGHFCGGCNRIRLTSEGFLKLCLYHDHGVPLRELLRSGADEHALYKAIAAAIMNKPERHFFGERCGAGGIGKMSDIGG